MRALVCCLNAPWPTVSGVDLRCWQSLNLLSERTEVGLFALTGSGHAPAGFPAAVWHVSRSQARELDPNAWLKSETGLPSDVFCDEHSAAELDRILREFAPDFVVLEQLWAHSFENVVRARGVPIVLNAHNVEAALAREVEDHEAYPPARLQRRILTARVGALEGDLARRANQIWVCSEEDRRAFLDDYAVRASVHVVPNAVDLARYRADAGNRPSEWSDAADPYFLFPGVFHYAPNQRAAAFLIDELFPKLSEKYPEGRLVLAGSNPTPQMLSAASQDRRIIVTGQVPDMVPYLKHASMMLVPLSEGGGTRFKIIEAFAAGLPVVSSAKGVEGLGAESGKHYLRAENSDDFLAAVGTILGDTESRRGLIQSASALVERFSWDTAREAINRALRELQI